MLVRIDGTYPYWWLLCPASATLYTDDKYQDCSIGEECDWDDVHEAAYKLRTALHTQDVEETSSDVAT